LYKNISSPLAGGNQSGERGKVMANNALKCSPGLDDRSQDQNGEIRRKRSDTQVGTLRETYGPDFGNGIRSDATLGTLLERSGSSSLSDYLKNTKE
jgi:hypothetical protein